MNEAWGIRDNTFLASPQMLFFKVANAFSRARKCFFARPLFQNR